MTTTNLEDFAFFGIIAFIGLLILLSVYGIAFFLAGMMGIIALTMTILAACSISYYITVHTEI